MDIQIKHFSKVIIYRQLCLLDCGVTSLSNKFKNEYVITIPAAHGLLHSLVLLVYWPKFLVESNGRGWVRVLVGLLFVH